MHKTLEKEGERVRKGVVRLYLTRRGVVIGEEGVDGDDDLCDGARGYGGGGGGVKGQWRRALKGARDYGRALH